MLTFGNGVCCGVVLSGVCPRHDLVRELGERQRPHRHGRGARRRGRADQGRVGAELGGRGEVVLDDVAHRQHGAVRDRALDDRGQARGLAGVVHELVEVIQHAPTAEGADDARLGCVGGEHHAGGVGELLEDLLQPRRRRGRFGGSELRAAGEVCALAIVGSDPCLGGEGADDVVSVAEAIRLPGFERLDRRDRALEECIVRVPRHLAGVRENRAIADDDGSVEVEDDR